MSSQGKQPEREKGQSKEEQSIKKEDKQAEVKQEQPKQQAQKIEQKKEVPKVEIPLLEKSIVDKVKAKFGDKVNLSYAKSKRIRFEVKSEDAIEFARFLKEEVKFDHPISVSGVDRPKENTIEAVYHFCSCAVSKYAPIVVAAAFRLPRDNPKMPTLIPVYRGVEYHEREAFEMLGIVFEGHPRLERLLLPEDWADIPPLRKDFSIKGR
ncbi:MAG: NADH-quinone oxidoreductase subunit C [Nitrososphaerales archaeon]